MELYRVGGSQHLSLFIAQDLIRNLHRIAGCRHKGQNRSKFIHMLVALGVRIDAGGDDLFQRHLRDGHLTGQDLSAGQADPVGQRAALRTDPEGAHDISVCGSADHIAAVKQRAGDPALGIGLIGIVVSGILLVRDHNLCSRDGSERGGIDHLQREVRIGASLGIEVDHVDRLLSGCAVPAHIRYRQPDRIEAFRGICMGHRRCIRNGTVSEIPAPGRDPVVIMGGCAGDRDGLIDRGV